MQIFMTPVASKVIVEVNIQLLWFLNSEYNFELCANPVSSGENDSTITHVMQQAPSTSIFVQENFALTK